VKTAVSIPDPLFRAADRVARQLGVSRSQLYARALERYLVAESDDDVTRRLNAVYEEEASRREPGIAEAQRKVTLRDS
jgi:metal-responsive CopG/Arc/MetJ family transcriptional regulator